MSISEQDKIIAWNAKGRGNRWRMLREVVAILALRPMHDIQIYSTMLRLRGLTQGMVDKLIGELETAGDIQVSDTDDFIWTASARGVDYWLEGTQESIPAEVARALPQIDKEQK